MITGAKNSAEAWVDEQQLPHWKLHRDSSEDDMPESFNADAFKEKYAADLPNDSAQKISAMSEDEAKGMLARLVYECSPAVVLNCVHIGLVDVMKGFGVVPSKIPLRKAESQNPKDLAGSRKPPLHLVPPVGIIYTAKVMEGGVEDYGEANWRTGPHISLNGYLDAIDRHFLALTDGEWLDRKSGLPHLAHIAATCFIMLDAEELGRLKHSDAAPGKAADLIEAFTKPLPDSTEVE